MSINRRENSHRTRLSAAELAQSRAHPPHEANPDEQRYAHSHYPMSFTKGLDHDDKTGLVKDSAHYEAFRRAIAEGFIDPFTSSVPVPDIRNTEGEPNRRQWEAPTAGTAYDLQGPDAQAVTMAPAPELGSTELDYEMAEVYELAILRDIHFKDFEDGGGAEVQASVKRLNDMVFDISGQGGGRPRRVASDDKPPPKTLSTGTAFRGSSPGCEVGPYVSQLLLIGNKDLENEQGTEVSSGQIRYGGLRIDQRIPVARPCDWMLDKPSWLCVQNGENVRNNGTLFDPNRARRFISTPRDMATYVHDDALYEAYLNACLQLLSARSPSDPAFDQLSGMGSFNFPNGSGGVVSAPRQAGGFALYGGPHILTLVTEVATRALKAVRYQKFNIHRRLRPETLAGRVECAHAIEDAHPELCNLFSDMKSKKRLGPTLDALKAFKKAKQLAKSKDPSLKVCPDYEDNFLLPMAFQEGSPMHPAYGAGHATVAGACTTILKAYFDTGAVLLSSKKKGISFRRPDPDDQESFVAFRASEDGSQLVPVKVKAPLTLEGELNKLAANISIGRNMAGVHYYSDYYDSVRMGEQIAIGILEEQALTYPTDPFVLTLSTFDGEQRLIGAR
ncbi:MAG: vanadium-dependent haloperoxidase [Myxococcota bacterium]